MFPVFDLFQEDVVEFQGRVLPGITGVGSDNHLDHVKYLHGGFAKVGGKKNALYGYYQVSELAVKMRSIVVVEGPMDVLTLWQCGIPAVATFGTTMSDVQATILAQTVEEVVSWTDADSAGEKAHARNCALLEPFGVPIYRAAHPTLKDPNEVYCQLGRKGIFSVINNAN